MSKRFLIRPLVFLVLLMSIFILVGCNDNEANDINGEATTNGTVNETNEDVKEIVEVDATILGVDNISVDELSMF